MISPSRLGCGILFCGLLGLGCQTAVEKTPATRPTPSDSVPMQMTVTARGPQSGNQKDPQPQLNVMVHLDIYLLDMPPGSVSYNREFWKRIDEEACGTASAQRLNRNGIRCGIAPRSEGLYFSHFFDTEPHPPARRSMVDGYKTDSIELEMEKNFDRQDLFFFDSADQLEGRSYDQGKNQLVLTFGPTPRDPGAVRLKLCPVVYSDKTRTNFTALNQEYDTPYKDVDRIYDLGLTFDVPGDSFLVIAPNGEATRRTSIGGCFLKKADKAQQYEQVILVVPTFLRLDGKPMMVREQLLK